MVASVLYCGGKVRHDAGNCDVMIVITCWALHVCPQSYGEHRPSLGVYGDRRSMFWRVFHVHCSPFVYFFLLKQGLSYFGGGTSDR
jgi:hypothetical protein